MNVEEARAIQLTGDCNVSILTTANMKKLIILELSWGRDVIMTRRYSKKLISSFIKLFIIGLYVYFPLLTYLQYERA